MQLSDGQVMVLAFSVIIPLSLLLCSNGRITEAKETLRAETAKLGAELRGEMAALRSEMQAGFARIEAALRVHELEHHR